MEFRGYNRKVKSASLCLAALVVLSGCVLSGCSKNIDTTEAVKQGIIRDISGKVNVGEMDVNVDSVSFRDREASANVSFRPKGGDPSQAITMTYQLERQGDEWHVKSRDMQRHEKSTPPPGTQVPGESGSQQLPPGHPAIGGEAQGRQLPPGHPAIGGSSPSPVVHQ
jgi:outer membrane murein-binding lipoprotein Lpp